MFPPVANLIVHEPPMRLIDEVVDELPAGLVCKTTIREDFVFLKEGVVDSLVCLELVAQTVACYSGLADVKEHGAPRGGLVVGVRDARFHADSLRLGDELLVRVTRQWIREPAASFTGEVERGGTVIANIELSVVAGASIDALIEGASS